MNSIFVNLAINIGFFSLFFLYFRQNLRKKMDPRYLLDEVNDEVNQVLLQLNNVTDRNIGLLENRIASLKDLVEQVDKRILLYRKEIEKKDAEPIVYSHLVKKRPGQSVAEINLKPVKIESPEPKEQKSTKEQVVELYRQGFSPDVIASRLGITLGEVELIISLTGRGL